MTTNPNALNAGERETQRKREEEGG
jgi:hypothetical protein